MISLIAAIACFFISLPRMLDQLSTLGTVSVFFTFVVIVLAIVFAGVQSHPFGYVEGVEPLVTAWPVKGTTYISGELPRPRPTLRIPDRLLYIPLTRTSMLPLTPSPPP